MKRKAILLPVAILVIFVALSVSLISSCAPPTSTTMFGDRIGLIHVEGVIQSGSSYDPVFGNTAMTSDRIVEIVEQAIDDTGIKALVVRINSPGGSAAASEEIYAAFERFQDTGRPVIVSMADVAASGGYYIAAPADYIYANGATLTGSIGVIMQLINYEGLFELIGLDDTTLTSGEFKDIGSGTRPMTEEEEEILQNMLDQVHEQFKDAVANGRDNLSKEDVEEIATGLIYNGQEAMELGLVDEIGGLHDAIMYASDLVGLGNDPIVDHLGQTGLLDQLMQDLGAVQSQDTGLDSQLVNALNGFNGGQSTFMRLYTMALLDPRVMGPNGGIQF